jgi:hypothetical protein
MIKITIEIEDNQPDEVVKIRLRVHGNNEKECQVADLVIDAIEDIFTTHAQVITTRNFKVQ